MRVRCGWMRRVMWMMALGCWLGTLVLRALVRRAAEMAHGLPRVVIDLAALIYGAGRGHLDCADCQYDSAGGLGGRFQNYMAR